MTAAAIILLLCFCVVIAVSFLPLLVVVGKCNELTLTLFPVTVILTIPRYCGVVSFGYILAARNLLLLDFRQSVDNAEVRADQLEVTRVGEQQQPLAEV